LGWQLLATTRYLAGDTIGALRAWNVIGRPNIDLLRIDGSRRIRFQVLANAMRISHGQALTPDRLAIAQRRLDDIPALAHATSTYAPIAGGPVEVRAVVVEPPLYDPVPLIIVGGAIRALVQHDAVIAIRSPLGAGDLWSAQWRWVTAAPRVVLRLDLPTPFGPPGTVTFMRNWETYRYADAIPTDRLRATSVAVSGWLRPDFEERAGLRFERWTTEGNFVSLFVGGAWHLDRDRFSLSAEGDHGFPLSGGVAYDKIRTLAAWRPTVDRWSNQWTFRLGADITGAHTPRGLLSVAGGDLAREIPLRAHPLFFENALPTAQTGRTIFYGTVSDDRSFISLGPIALGLGAFLDGARVTSPDVTSPSRMYLDAGAGLLVGAVGMDGYLFRVDIARGLATGPQWNLSVSLSQPFLWRLGRG
jgi:hypothetical protein